MATVLIAAAVAVTDSVFTYLYFFVALFVALVFPEPRRMAPFLVLVVAALLAPLAYEDEPSARSCCGRSRSAPASC